MKTATTRTLRNGADVHADAVHRLAATAHQTVDRVAEQASAIENDLRHRAADLGDEVREQEKRARAAAERGAKKARAYLRKEPLRGAAIVAGIALAAGALLGAVLLRR